MTSVTPARVLVAGFEFEQPAFRGTSYYARALLRTLNELGLETLLLTSAAASSERLIERLAVVRQLFEPRPSTKWRRRTGFLRDVVWPARARLVAPGKSEDVIDRVDYLRWVDACLNRPAVYDYVRIRSHRRWPAYRVPDARANLVITPAPIHIRAPRGAPLVVSFHDMAPVLRADHPPHDDADEFLCRLRNMERHADAVLCSSDAARRELVSHFPALADRCTVIHPPVSLFAEEVALSTEPEIERGVLARYGLEPNGYLLYLGVIERKKNVRRLVDAYGAARRELGIPLVLAGWLGYGADDVKLDLAQGGQWLRHIGYVSQLEKIVLLRNARALVFPSLYEGFGLPPIEAMQVGCPVLASNIPAVAEACGDGAYFVDCRSLRRLSDGLVRIANDRPLQAELAGRGLRRAEQLSLRNYRDQLGAFLGRFVSVQASNDVPVPVPADAEARPFFHGRPLAVGVAPASER